MKTISDLQAERLKTFLEVCQFYGLEPENPEYILKFKDLDSFTKEMRKYVRSFSHKFNRKRL